MLEGFDLKGKDALILGATGGTAKPPPEPFPISARG
jgi:hypothetical protein